MKTVTFLGTGSFHSAAKYGDTNCVVKIDGESLLVDCGTGIIDAFSRSGLEMTAISAVYISHQHGDHLGGLSSFAMSAGWSPARPLPVICHEDVVHHVTEQAAGSIQLTVVRDSFVFAGVSFTMHPFPHITGRRPMTSFGLSFAAQNGSVVLTTDVNTAHGSPADKQRWMELFGGAVAVFHDTEAGRQTGVHTHVLTMQRYPANVQAHLMLVHYDDVSTLSARLPSAKVVDRGVVYDLDAMTM